MPSAAFKLAASAGVFPSRIAQFYDPVAPRRDPLQPKEQEQVQEGLKQWSPSLLETDSTPIPEMLASPTRQGTIAGLLGAAAGAGLGRAATHYDKALPMNRTMAAGAALVGVPAALYQALHRNKKNQSIVETMRRLPPGATKRDYEAERMLSESFENKFGADKMAGRVKAPHVKVKPHSRRLPQRHKPVKRSDDAIKLLAQAAAAPLPKIPPKKDGFIPVQRHMVVTLPRKEPKTAGQKTCNVCSNEMRGAWCPVCRTFSKAAMFSEAAKALLLKRAGLGSLVEEGAALGSETENAGSGIGSWASKLMGGVSGAAGGAKNLASSVVNSVRNADPMHTALLNRTGGALAAGLTTQAGNPDTPGTPGSAGHLGATAASAAGGWLNPRAGYAYATGAGIDSMDGHSGLRMRYLAPAAAVGSDVVGGLRAAAPEAESTASQMWQARLGKITSNTLNAQPATGAGKALTAVGAGADAVMGGVGMQRQVETSVNNGINDAANKFTAKALSNITGADPGQIHNVISQNDQMHTAIQAANSGDPQAQQTVMAKGYGKGANGQYDPNVAQQQVQTNTVNSLFSASGVPALADKLVGTAKTAVGNQLDSALKASGLTGGLAQAAQHVESVVHQFSGSGDPNNPSGMMNMISGLSHGLSPIMSTLENVSGSVLQMIPGLSAGNMSGPQKMITMIGLLSLLTGGLGSIFGGGSKMGMLGMIGAVGMASGAFGGKSLWGSPQQPGQPTGQPAQQAGQQQGQPAVQPSAPPVQPPPTTQTDFASAPMAAAQMAGH